MFFLLLSFLFISFPVATLQGSQLMLHPIEYIKIPITFFADGRGNLVSFSFKKKSLKEAYWHIHTNIAQIYSEVALSAAEDLSLIDDKTLNNAEEEQMQNITLLQDMIQKSSQHISILPNKDDRKQAYAAARRLLLFNLKNEYAPNPFVFLLIKAEQEKRSYNKIATELH